MESKVYITQDNRKNYSQASKFGDPVFVTDLEFSDVKNSRSNSEIRSHLSDLSEVYNPNYDYILLSGDPVILFITGLELGKVLKKYGFVRILKWSSQDRLYVSITIKENILTD